MKRNKKPIIFMLLLSVVCMVAGGTLAYYTSTDTFNNEFNAGTYQVETFEKFVSPENWTPGTTTEKKVYATNHGSLPVAVRVKLTPSWVDANGDPLPLYDNNYEEAAIINYSTGSGKWYYDNETDYYYYYRALEEGQTTSTIIDSVTFNEYVEFNENKNCNTVNGQTSCRTTFNGYAGGTYTLLIDIETCQYDQYENIWNPDVTIDEPLIHDTLKVTSNNISYTFGKNINKSNFEIIRTVNHINIPNNAIDSWDVSAEYSESVMVWYTDEDNNGKYEMYIGQDGGVRANPNSKELFSNYNNVKLIDLTYFDTTGVTSMYYMFSQTGINTSTFEIIGLENFDTSQVTTMETMFQGVGSIANTVELNLTGWDTSNVENMRYMFNNCGGSFNSNTSSVVIIGLDDWNTSKVTDMSSMFNYVGYKATTFDIGDLSGWDTSKVTDMHSMFNSAGNNSTTWIVGDLSGWDTSKVNDMHNMFSSTGRNATLWSVGDLSSWNTSSVTNMNSMFNSAGDNATTFNSIGTLKVYTENINKMFNNAKKFKGTINIYSNPTNYTDAFKGSASGSGAGITVNYASTTTNIDSIIATKSNNSNVVKGSQLD